jgi:hypothetical protein
MVRSTHPYIETRGLFQCTAFGVLRAAFVHLPINQPENRY